MLLLLQEEKEKIFAAAQVRAGAAAAHGPQAGIQEAGSVLGGMGLLGPTSGTVFGDLGSLPSHRTLADISTPMSRPLGEH